MGVLASFRDADQPRPLLSRFVAVAEREAGHWRVDLGDGSVVYAATFESAVEAVTASTGLRRLLIHWLANR